MKLVLMTAVVVAVMLVVPPLCSAQHASGFAGIVLTTTENDELVPGVGGGGVIDLLGSWLSVGAQADLLTKNGYFGGRGGPIAQVNFVRGRSLRLFANGGMMWGVEDGPLFGGGVEFWSAGKVGFRATVHDSPIKITQDFRGRSYTKRRPSLQLALTWR